MKKILLLSALFLLSNFVSSQTINSIVPNTGSVGATISAVITSQNTFFQVGSQHGIQKVRLIRGQCPVLDAINVTIIDTEHVSLDFVLPATIPDGAFDLEIVKYTGPSIKLNSGFTVSGGTVISMNSISPAVVSESQIIDFTIGGQNLNLLVNTGFVVSFNKGSYSFNMTNYTILNNDSLLINTYVPGYIDSGNYSVTIYSSNLGCYSLPGGINIQTSNPKQLVSISPSQANAGTTLSALVTARNTFFMSGSPQGLNMIQLQDQNCNVITATNVNILSDTTVSADFPISATERNGLYDLFVQTRMNTSYLLPLSFEVMNGMDKDVLTFSPPNALANTQLFATITGLNLSNIISATPVTAELKTSSGFTITAINVSATSATDADVYFDLPVYAENTSYDFKLSSAAGCYTLPQVLQVTGGVPRELVSINPSTGYRGQALSAVITGINTFFMPGTVPGGIKKVDFNGQMPGNYNFTVFNPNITVLDSTHAMLNFTVPPGMRSGYYDVTSEYMDGVRLTLHPGFEIRGVILAGNVTFDFDSSGTLNAGDVPLAGRKVLLLPDSIIALTKTNGDYLFSVDSGQYSIEMFGDTNWFVTTSPSQYSISVDTNDISLLDFGLQPIIDEYDMFISIASGNPRCNTNMNYNLSYTNHSTTSANGQVYLVIDTALQYVSSTPPHSTISNDTIYWNYSNLPVSATSYIYASVHIPATPGDTIVSHAGVTAIDNGNVASEHMNLSSQVIRCSFDPNDKSVDPPGVGQAGYVLVNDYLEYLIRFQNTGNDTAYAVMILDTISDQMDMSTFSVISTSHLLETHLFGNVVEFRFNNIMLPDSIVDEPASHGFVKYRIRAKSNIIVGTRVENTAGIYFDLNHPVITNTTSNTITDQLPVQLKSIIKESKGQLLIYPNPSSQNFTIIIPESFGSKNNVRIFDSKGQLIQNLITASGNVSIDGRNWSEGVYYVIAISTDSKIISHAKIIRIQ